MKKQLLFKHSMGLVSSVCSISFLSNSVTAQSFGVLQTNPFSLTAVGTWSSPALGDLDGDGDKDLMAGQSSGTFTYFENIGTANSPIFGSAQALPFSLTAIGSTSTLSFGDLDDDGDLDLMAAEISGNFKYFENTGTSSAPSFGAVQTNPFGLSTAPGLGSYNPCLADMDNDGDLDLWLGDYYGAFYYYENTGTSSSPSFASVQTNPFSLTGNGSLSSPALGDVDNDGDLDLISGENSGTGNLKYYENTGTASAPVFASAQTNPFGLTAAGGYVLETAFGDLDGDGDPDLLVGNTTGNFYYYENTTSSLGLITFEVSSFSACPNPAKTSVVIASSENIAENVFYELYTLSGQLVLSGAFTGATNRLEIGHLEAGMYVLKIKGNDGVQTIKLSKN